MHLTLAGSSIGWIRRTYAWLRQAKAQRWLQIAWVTLACVFLAVYLSRQWRAFAAHEWRIATPWLALAVLLALLRKLLGGVQWGLILRYGRGGGDRGEWLRDLRVYFLSSLASYIPGSVWMVASRVQLNREQGASALVTSTGMVLEAALFIWSSCLVSLYLAVDLLPERRLLMAVVAALVLFSFVILQPSVATWLARPLQRLLPGLVARIKRATCREGVLLLAVAILLWVAAGVSHFFLLRAFLPALPFSYLPAVTSAFALAWTAGYLTPIAPAGLGVRDGLLAALFALWVPAPVAIVVALASRLLLALEDVFWVLTASFLHRSQAVPRP